MYAESVHLFVIRQEFPLLLIGEWRTNMTERVRSHLLQSPHFVNAHVRLCLAKHIRLSVYAA